MNENIQGKSCKVKVVPHIEFTPEQKFEFLLHNIINHKFLNYHPYLMEDNDVIKDAEERAREFSNYPTSILQFMNQCCSLCHTGSLRTEENPYTSDGDIVEYKIIPIKFHQGKDTQEIIVNKSDFNPRQYLTVCGCTIFTSEIFAKKNCDKYTTETEKHIKTCSTINGEGEIDKYQNCRVLLAYSIPTMSGFGKLRMSHRLYTLEDDQANVIREQILRTQQYLLCSIINDPRSIIKKEIFDKAIFDKFLPQLKQMYDLLCVEIAHRGIDNVVKDIYLPPILEDIKDYFSSNIDDDPFIDEYYEEKEEYIISKYKGMFAIKRCMEDIWDVPHILDRDGNIFKPRLHNSIDFIESIYENVSYEQVGEDGLIVCYADDISLEYCTGDNYGDCEDDDEDGLELQKDEYEHCFYFDECEDAPEINNYYLGVINKYGQTIFELRSLTGFWRDRYNSKFGFKIFDENYLVIYLTDSYSVDKDFYTKCGAINIKTGTLVIPLILTEEEIKRELSCGQIYDDKRYYRPGWIISHYLYGDDEYIFQGPIYKSGNEILEQGKYAGYTIEDALHYFGNEILTELIFEEKIFLADTVFPINIAHFSSIQRSVKLHQDKKLKFDPITSLDDTISTYSDFAYNNDIVFHSLYEGKTLQEIIEEDKGMFYIINLVNNGVLIISEEVIDELMDEKPEIYLPLKKAYQSHQDYL